MPSECKLARKVYVKIGWETQHKNLEVRLNWAEWFRGRWYKTRTNQIAVTRQGLGPEQRLEFAWEIYDKATMRMRLKCRNWKAETGTGQGERQDCNKGRRRWVAELKPAKTAQKSKHLPKDVPVQDLDWNPGLWTPLFLWFLNILISKKPVNSVGIKTTVCNVSVFPLCLTKSLLSPYPSLSDEDYVHL